MLNLIPYVIAIVAIYMFLQYLNSKMNAYKGIRGELLIFEILEALQGKKYILRNLYIPKEDGTTTEADVVMIHEKGIFVFESKNYSGWIFGSEKGKSWTQSLNKSTKVEFPNPIFQNQGHIKALQRILSGVNAQIYRSYIVFSERCELKKVPENYGNVIIVKRNELKQSITRLIDSLSVVLTPEEVIWIGEQLKPLVYVDSTTKEKHIQNIKAKYESQNP